MLSDDSQRTLNLIGGTIAIALTTMLGATIFALVRLDVPANNQNALLILIGALTTNVTAIVAYFFGTSAGSKIKDATTNTMAATIAQAQAALPSASADKTVPIAPGETVAVKSAETAP